MPPPLPRDPLGINWTNWTGCHAPSTGAGAAGTGQCSAATPQVSRLRPPHAEPQKPDEIKSVLTERLGFACTQTTGTGRGPGAERLPRSQSRSQTLPAGAFAAPGLGFPTCERSSDRAAPESRERGPQRLGAVTSSRFPNATQGHQKPKFECRLLAWGGRGSRGPAPAPPSSSRCRPAPCKSWGAAGEPQLTGGLQAAAEEAHS